MELIDLNSHGSASWAKSLNELVLLIVTSTISIDLVSAIIIIIIIIIISFCPGVLHTPRGLEIVINIK